MRRKYMLFHMRIAELAGCPFLRMDEVLQRLEPFLSLNHAELSAALASARR